MHSNIECPICYEGITKDNSFTTKCKHVFCSKCYKILIKHTSKCPICRTNISTLRDNQDVHYEIQVVDIVYFAISYYLWSILKYSEIYVNYNMYIQITLSIYVMIQFVQRNINII